MYLTPPPPRVLAHRGLALEAPENTLLAFAKALAIGVTHVETDVRASADGVAVIAHDATLERMAGRDVRVDQLTMPELRRVDLGVGQGFVSLAEALDTFGEARFNIDIKSADAVEATARVIAEARARDRVLVTSFSDERRRAALELVPGAATSLSALSTAKLLATSRMGWRRRARRVLEGIDAIQIPERWKGVRVLTPRLLEAAHTVGVEVHVWTVNDPADMERLLDLGVDGIVTDRADLALEVLDRRA